MFEIRVDAYAALTGRSSRQGSLYEQLAEAVQGLQHAEVRLPGGETNSDPGTRRRSTSRASPGSRSSSTTDLKPYILWAFGNTFRECPRGRGLPAQKRLRHCLLSVLLVLVRIGAKGLADDRGAIEGVARNPSRHIGTDARFDFQGDQIR